MVVSPDCLKCRRFWPKFELKGYVPVCDAYPDGIPGEIYAGLRQHRSDFEGDHGLHFEPGKPHDGAKPPWVKT